MSALQPRQFFHATRGLGLEPGQQILPGRMVGRDNYGMSGRDRHVYTATTEAEAASWTPDNYNGRPEIYKVAPAPGTKMQGEHEYINRWMDDHEDPTHALADGPMDIIDRIDIPDPFGGQDARMFAYESSFATEPVDSEKFYGPDEPEGRDFDAQYVLGVQGTLPKVDWNPYDQSIQGDPIRRRESQLGWGANAKWLLRPDALKPEHQPRPVHEAADEREEIPGQERLF